MFPDLVGQISTEDSKKIRELVRNAAIRDDRKLTPRELENVAVAAEQILSGLEPLFKQQAKATGSKKGAISKHINRILDALLEGDEIAEEDAKLVAGIDMKNLDRARDLGNGLLADVVDTWDGEQDIRELTNDLCLPHGREDPEGRPRRAHPVGPQGPRDVPRHRVAPAGRS
jgi:hypothetical protein